jgi:hypothetical protein
VTWSDRVCSYVDQACSATASRRCRSSTTTGCPRTACPTSPSSSTPSSPRVSPKRLGVGCVIITVFTNTTCIFILSRSASGPGASGACPPSPRSSTSRFPLDSGATFTLHACPRTEGSLAEECWKGLSTDLSTFWSGSGDVQRHRVDRQEVGLQEDRRHRRPRRGTR